MCLSGDIFQIYFSVTLIRVMMPRAESMGHGNLESGMLYAFIGNLNHSFEKGFIGYI